MSHTNPERMRELVTTIRAIEAEYGRPIGVLVDLQGPKLRVGTFKDGAANIDTGQDFTFDANAAPGDANRVQLRILKYSPRSSRTIHFSSTTASFASRQSRYTATDRGACRSRRQSVKPQRRQPAGHGACRWRRWRRKTLLISRPLSMPASIGSLCRSFSARRTSPKRKSSRAAAPR